MPAETGPEGTLSKQIPDIPLHLIPKTIADQIKGKHMLVYRITARKMFQNRYTLIVETRKRNRQKIHNEGLPGSQDHEND